MENRAEPKVSVIIPTYNRPQLIGRAIKSVLDQTYKNIEIVVIDGDPTGATSGALEPLVKEHPGVVIDFVFKQLPRTNTPQDMANIARNRNAGIRIAKGKYIAALDDDDYWPDPKKIEKQVVFMETHPDYSLVSGDTVGTIKNKDGTETRQTNHYPENDKDIRKMILMPFGISNSTVMYRKSDWERVGGYDEIRPMGETQDFHLKLGKIGKFYNFKDYFMGYVWGGHERDHIVNYGRYCLWDSLLIIWTYRKDYPRFYKAFFVHAMYFLYTFIPRWVRRIIRPIAMKAQFFLFRKFAGTDSKKEPV